MFESKLHAFSLRFASVESIRQDVAQEALQSQNRSMTFSVAASIYRVFTQRQGMKTLDPEDICQYLGGKEERGLRRELRSLFGSNTEPCTCSRKWSEACGPYLKTKKILDMHKCPDQAGDPDRCYCPGSRAETRVLRKEVKVSALRFCQSLFEDATDAWRSTGHGSFLRAFHLRRPEKGPMPSWQARQHGAKRPWCTLGHPAAGQYRNLLGALTASVTGGSGILTRCAKMNARSWWI